MSTTLILPDRYAPTNLHLRPSVKTRYVESDLFDIAARLRGIDASLYIVQLEEGQKHSFAIMEHCVDGVDRLIFRVAELDARVLDRIGYLMHVDFETRYKIAEDEVHEYEADKKENELEELYENLGRQMHTQMVHDGFSLGTKSYAKRGHTGGRGSLVRV